MTLDLLPSGEDPAAALAGGPDGALVGGRYRLGELLGVGGSAAVYEAEDVTQSVDGRPGRVAVKVLHAHLCATDAARDAFLREAGRASRVRHPNIVAVRASGLHDAGGVVMAWIALDLVVGRTLAERIEERGPLGLAQAAAVMDGVLAGLGAAHDAGLVHRDVSPRNVVLDDAGAAGAPPITASRVRLLDFGLADVAGRTTLGTGVLLTAEPDLVRPGDGGSGVVGNANYISPEQAMGMPVTAAGDLYQAGGLLYFLLTGRPPYPRMSVQQVIEAHLSAPSPVPSALVPGASPLDRVVTRSLAKEPTRRFPDAASFRDAIKDAVAAGRAPGPTTTDHSAAGPTPTRVMPLRHGWTPEEHPRRSAGPEKVPAPSAGAVDYLGSAEDAAASGGAPTPARPAAGGVLVAGVAIAGVAVLAVLSAFAPGAHPQAAPSSTPGTPSPPATTSASASPSAVVQVSVPTVHGTLADAEAALQAAGLTLGKVSRVPSGEARDTVLGQSPRAGSSIPLGTAVNVRLASGSNVVPPVSGMSAAAAVAALQSAGFTVRTSSPILAGSTPVVRTDPEEGTVLRLGVTVTLVLSDDLPTSSPSTSGSPTATPSP